MLRIQFGHITYVVLADSISDGLIEKERFEVLLEEIRNNVRTVAEGHDSLRQEMKRGFESLRQELSELRSQLTMFAKHTSNRLSALEAK